MKAISAVIATIMLLMISVSLIGVFYAFSSVLAGSVTSSSGQQTSQFMSQLAMCMRIDNINGNKVDLRNCGKGVIDSKSLIVTMDDIKLNSSLQTIAEDSSGTVNISGLWQIAPGKHNLKISNGATFAQALVDVQPNRDGLVGSWNFNEGSGITANDGSGNGNSGTIIDNEGDQWTAGKFGKGLQFDGANDYISIPDSNSLDFTNAITVAAWTYRDSSFSGQWDFLSKSSHFLFRLRHDPYYHPEIWLQLTSGWQRVFMAGNPIPRNEWHFVAFSYDGTWTKVYVDGNFIGQDNTYTGNMVPSLGTLSINDGLAKGIIDEVRIWNRALAPDETVVMKQII